MPIDVTLSGIVMLVKPVQSSKAILPIDVTLLGNLAEWTRQVEECRNSGLSVRAWCEQNGIAVSTYIYITASKLWLEPLYDRLKEQLLKESVLHADETTLRVLRTKEKPTATKSYM